MNKADFITEVEDILQADPGTLTMETRLEDIEGWDSSGLLGIIALLDGELEIDINVEKIRNCVTFQELFDIAADKLD